MLYLMLTFCCKRGSTISQKQRISSYYDSQMALPGKLNIICCSNPPVFKSCCNFSSAQSIQLPNQSNFGSYSEFFLLFYHDLIQDGVSMPLGIAVGNWDSSFLVPWHLQKALLKLRAVV